jgi:hypothetical protein
LVYYVLFLAGLGGVAYFRILGEVGNYEVLAVVFAVLIGIKITELHRFYHKYEINPISVVHIKGFLAKKSRRMSYHAISDLEVRQSFWQRLWGYGDVKIILFSGGAADLITDINHPHWFASMIEQRIKHSKHHAPEEPVSRIEPELYDELHEGLFRER